MIDFKIIENLTSMMRIASKELDFEKAIELRDKITELKNLKKKLEQN